jgi:hypothetical protein
MEEEQKTQWPKEKVQKDKQWSTKHHSWQVVLDTTLCDKVCQWLAAYGRLVDCFIYSGFLHHDIAEILLKVALSTITLTHSIFENES